MRIGFIFSFLLISISVFSQKKSTLSVKDAITNESLPYCHINVEKLNGDNVSHCVTNLNGVADFNYSGSVIFNITYVGYLPVVDTVNHYSKLFNYKLKPNVLNLKEVVITGHNKPISIDKSIYNIKLIGKEKIEQKASNNLAELLSNELNIQINNDPSTGSSVKMQGVSGENVKILIDGVPVIGRMDGNIDLSQINLDEVNHIEIVEGPMSVMYGSNALAGVINIITKENKCAKLKTGVDTYYESVGVYNINGNVSLKRENQSLGVNFGRDFFQGYSPNLNSRSMQWKPKEQYTAGLYYIYDNKKIKIKYKVNAFKERLLNRNNPPPPYFERANDTWFYTLRLNNSLQTNYDISEYSSANLLLSYSYYDRTKKKYLKDLTNLETTISPNETDHDTTLFNAFMARGVYNYSNPNKKISCQVGFDFNAETAQGKRIKNESEDIGDYALFTSLQWKINSDIVVQPAVRVSYNTKYNAPITPSVNVKYQIDNTNLRLSYSRGFRAPSLKELYLYFYDSNHQIEGNDNLKAENSHNYNIAVTNKSEIFNRAVEFRLNGFYNKINERITLIQVDPDNGLHYRNENIGEFESVGGTFIVCIKPASFMDINIGVSETGKRDNYYESESFIYSTNANSNLTLKLFKNTTTFSVFYKYIGRYPRYYYNSKNEVEIGHINGYQNMDITLSYKMFQRKLVLSAGVKNLFDNVNIGGVGSGGSAHSGASSTLVGWGRTYFAGLKFNVTKY
ncbi:MAG: TonB-dependent receptor [Bacteroidota bacterium]|nr:TonB-dependent receptor [Bacteroidota bacterium]